MARTRTLYRCDECGAVEPKWAGRCTACEAWDSLVEEAIGRVAVGVHLGPAGDVPLPIAEVDNRLSPPRRPTSASWTACSRAAWCPGRSPCSVASPGSASPRCCSRRSPAWPRPAGAASTSRPRSRPSRSGSGPSGSARFRRTCGSWPTPRSRTCSTTSMLSPPTSWRSTRSRPSSIPMSSAPGSVAQVRECAHRFVRASKDRA